MYWSQIIQELATLVSVNVGNVECMENILNNLLFYSRQEEQPQSFNLEKRHTIVDGGSNPF